MALEEQSQMFLKDYLSNLQVYVWKAHYGKSSLHWGETNENPSMDRFYLFKGGEGYIIINGQEYRPAAGQLFLLPAGVSHSFGTISSNTFEKYYTYFTAKIGDMNLFQLLDMPYYIQVQDAEKTERLFGDLVHSYRSNSITAHLTSRAALLGLISYFIDHSAIRKVNVAQSSAMEKIHLVIRYIELHLNENVTVDELAELIHFHPNYFIHFFKKTMGISPVQFVNRARIEKAKQLLRSTDMSVADVAEKVGFQALHFTKAFKKTMGLTPGEFRKSIHP